MPREYPEKRISAAGAAAVDEAFVDAYLPALLAQAHQLVASAFHPLAAAHGLGPSEWRVLATLASGDTLRALCGGFLASVPFDVIDLDAYGSPWAFLRALLVTPRTWAPSTWIVLTDGYFAPRGMADADKTLFPGMKVGAVGTSLDGYVDTARARIREWLPAGLVLESMQSWTPKNRPKGVATHVLRVRRTPPA